MVATTAATPKAAPALSVRSLVLMALILLAVFGPIFLGAAMEVGDFRVHIRHAMNLKASGDFTALPRWVYHVLVIAFSDLLPNAPSHIHGWLGVLLPYTILGLMIFALLDRHLATNQSRHTVFAGLLTLALLSITPIYLLMSLDTSFSWTYLLGYVNATAYHSPTQNVLKLWVIPVSLFALRAVQTTAYASRNERIGLILLLALLVALMTLTKPNYTMCLLPALGLVTLYKFVTKSAPDWPLLILGIGLPAVGVLAFQYLNTFGDVEGSSGMAFGFLTVMRAWEIPIWQIPVRLLLSTAFPLVVYGLHFRSARHDPYLNLSWLIFFIGLAYAYAFHETGSRMPAGNFIWGAYAALFVLMYASVVFLIREYKNRLVGRRSLNRLPWRLQVVGLIFGLHMIFAIVLWISYTFLYVAAQ